MRTLNQMTKNYLKIVVMVSVFGCIIFSCNATIRPYGMCPVWAQDAIWYQIFPERFCNGDQANDPTIETLEGTWPYERQTEWSVTPWTADWYKLQPWEQKNGRGFYYNAQLRRYGGDIQGILDKLDYLSELGINAIYLNPVFESASAHKYGATMYHHIDNNFGPDPVGDVEIWESENPANPATWQWTAADKLFLKLIREVHLHKMKIIIDGVFNHVGIPFWAFQDVREKGQASKYANWFVIKSFDDPQTAVDEFEYQGWYGFTDLPEIAEDENGPVQSFRDHIQAVVKRWGDPDGDGDPSDGVDGWRLDVAEMISKSFWRDFRKWVKSVNPNAYLTGEVWWQDFPHNQMFAASPWLQGDIFDGVMNYRFCDAMLKALVNQKQQIMPTKLDSLLKVVRDYPGNSPFVSQNILGSHDTERFASMVINPDRWLDHASNLNYDKSFKVNCPSANERKIQKTILAFQFTYLGAPYIYYGDEVGMWGADDPDCRKPMIWSDYKYEDEQSHPFNLSRVVDSVKPDLELFRFYQQLIAMRKQYPSLSRGSYRTVDLNDEKGIFGFERHLGDEIIRAIFNLSENDWDIEPAEYLDGRIEQWIPISVSAPLTGKLLAKSFIIVKKGVNA